MLCWCRYKVLVMCYDWRCVLGVVAVALWLPSTCGPGGVTLQACLRQYVAFALFDRLFVGPGGGVQACAVRSMHLQ